jgi:hypothetical protein
MTELRGGLRRCGRGFIPATTSASNLGPVQETYRLSSGGAIRTLQPPMPEASNNRPSLHDSRPSDLRARWTNMAPAGAFSLTGSAVQGRVSSDPSALERLRARSPARVSHNRVKQKRPAGSCRKSAQRIVAPCLTSWLAWTGALRRIEECTWLEAFVKRVSDAIPVTHAEPLMHYTYSIRCIRRIGFTTPNREYSKIRRRALDTK